MNNVDPKEAFHHLYDAMTEYQTRFINTTLQGMAAIIIVIGWVVSQETARSYLIAHPGFRGAGAAVILIVAGAYTTLSWKTRTVTRDLRSELRALDYLPPAYYQFRDMKLVHVLLLMVFVDAPCLLVAGYLFCPGRFIR